MKKIYIILTIILSLFIFSNNVKAETYSSDFININDMTYTYSSDELNLSNVRFNKYSLNSNGIVIHGVLYGDMENVSGHYLSVYMYIDYYDRNYNVIARSTKEERPSEPSNNYVMSIGLYEEEFLGDYSVDDIKYFKIKYYTQKGNPLPNSSNKPIVGLKPSEYDYYKSYEYVIDEYNINVVVNENNTFDITEEITAYFNIYKHGIYRTIPSKNSIVRLDGTKSNNRAVVTNVFVDKKFELLRENGDYKIKIGSSDVTLIGEQKYLIKYNYNIGKDPLEDKDELYFNLIGTDWDTVIGNVNFKITMPKDFDENKLGFSHGDKGSINSDNVVYTVEDNVITGKFNGLLNPGEALTVRTELPEGYFVGAGIEISDNVNLMFIIPVIGFIICFFIWYKYGKDEPVVETVEFYPPNGFNSLELAYLYKGDVTDNDVTSLLIYLANKGYIKITESEEKALFSKSKDFIITKVKEYDGNNVYERIFFNGLFSNNHTVDYRKVSKLIKERKLLGQKLSYSDAIDIVSEQNKGDKTSVTSYDLYDSFYRTVNSILNKIDKKENKYKIFEKGANNKLWIMIVAIIVSYLTIFAVPNYEYGGGSQLFFGLLLCLFYIPFFSVGIFTNMPKGVRIFWLVFTTFHFCMFFMTMPVASAIINERIFLIAFILGIILLIGMIICIKNLPKRTPYGNEMFGKIKGFKNFLEVAEKEKLEAMVAQNPNYFYDILPFTYVLGVSDKWIKKFETISMREPDWYSSPSGFSVGNFGSFMNNTMSSVQSASSSGSSSSSSGGGSSGGGSGGGGGGSW